MYVKISKEATLWQGIITAKSENFAIINVFYNYSHLYVIKGYTIKTKHLLVSI